MVEPVAETRRCVQANGQPDNQLKAGQLYGDGEIGK